MPLIFFFEQDSLIIRSLQLPLRLMPTSLTKMGLLFQDNNWQSCISHISRLDTTYAIHIAGQFMTTPSMITLLQLFKFFAMSRIPYFMIFTFLLTLTKGWVFIPMLQRWWPFRSLLQLGCYYFLDSSIISWHGKKQTTLTHSMWLRWLLVDMEVYHNERTVIYCDNRSAIQIVYNDIFHELIK